MPSWVWTDVILHGSLEALAEFVERECNPDDRQCLWRKAEAPPGLEMCEHSYNSLGFDGFVTNEDCGFSLNARRIMGEEVLVLQAHFETRWNPPLVFFERMTIDHPLLTFYMKVEHEDEDTYPQGWFVVQSTLPLLLPPPPPSPPPAPIHSTIEDVDAQVQAKSKA